jgi:hypothetical protein
MEKISWKSLEYKKKEKTADWYWAVGIITLSLIIISIILKNYSFVILLIIGVITIFIFSTKDPEILEITIDKRGLIVNKNMYPFASLESFWIDISEEDNHKLILRSKKTFMTLIIIPIDEMHHLDIRDFLLNFLPEIEMHEPTIYKIMDRLGF